MARGKADKALYTEQRVQIALPNSSKAAKEYARRYLTEILSVHVRKYFKESIIIEDGQKFMQLVVRIHNN